MNAIENELKAIIVDELPACDFVVPAITGVVVHLEVYDASTHAAFTIMWHRALPEHLNSSAGALKAIADGAFRRGRSGGRPVHPILLKATSQSRNGAILSF